MPPKKHICQIFGCSNYVGQQTDPSTEEKLRFHNFPKDKERCKKWMLLTRREDLLTASLSSVSNRRVCSKHFERKMYNNPNDYLSSSLRHDAYPTLHLPRPPVVVPERRQLIRHDAPRREVKRRPNPSTESAESPIPEPSPNIPMSVSMENEASDVSPCTEYRDASTQIRFPSKKVAVLRTQLRRYKFENRSLKQRILSLETSNKLARRRYDARCQKLSLKSKNSVALSQLPDHEAKFVEEQVTAFNSQKSSKGMRWSKATVEMSQLLLFKSPSCFKVLKGYFALPSTRTLMRKAPKTSKRPGICAETLSMLTTFMDSADPKDKSAVLILDAMYVKKNLEYNAFEDRVIGVEDVGAGERGQSHAQCLLVFMLRGIFGGWTQVIGHHFTKASFPKEAMRSLVMSYLAAIEKTGIECHGLICDQEPAHVSLFKSLGVTRETPFFHSESNRRIFVIYDPPHLIKSTRNNLLTSDFVENGDLSASWKDISDLFNLEKLKALRKAPQLTLDHIQPSLGQKMKVSLATQVFSHRSAAAMRSLKDELASSAEKTADILDFFNRVFDFCNSSNLQTCGTRRPALLQLWAEQQNDLHSWTTRLASIDFRNRKTGILKRSLPFKEGWLITLRSMDMLISDLLSREGVFFVLTRRLNQDPLEHLFSAIRSRGGHNDHPTVRQAAAAIRILSCGAFLRRGLSANANVEEEGDSNKAGESEIVTCASSSNVKEVVEHVSEESGEEDAPSQHDESIEWISPLSDRDTLVYVAGSVLRRLSCDLCFEKLGRFVSRCTAEDFSKEIIFDRSNLFEPNNSFINSLSLLLQPVTSFFHQNIFLSKIVEHAVRRFPIDQHFCSDDHRTTFLTFFYRTIVRTVCKELNSPVSFVHISKYRKLNV